jgi:flagellar biosynthetic protein FlhB
VSQDNKTEKATPRRRQKAREKGQVARSRDLISSMATMTAVVLVAVQAPVFLRDWRTLLRGTLESAVAGSDASTMPVVINGWQFVVRATVLAIALSWLAAVLGAVGQGGLVFAPSALAFNPSRLSPAARMEQLFSLSAVSRMLKSLLPASVIVYLGFAILVRDWDGVLHLPNFGIAGLAGFSLGRMFEVAWKSALTLLVWAAVDYMLERRKHESDLRMSRQELIDEFKETEGNPATKARIRRLQRQLRRRRMLDEVKRASVVITNPTHFAVGLAYGPEMSAPVVVAKGRNLLAEQIKQVARWHGIALVENPPLAHALYRAVEVGQSIPPKLYVVVANILAAIYRAQERANASASMGSSRR